MTHVLGIWAWVAIFLNTAWSGAEVLVESFVDENRGKKCQRDCGGTCQISGVKLESSLVNFVITSPVEEAFWSVVEILLSS